MPTRNVVLTGHQEKLIERLVATGRYQNASEVLREGVRLVEQREAEDQVRIERLRAAVQVGIADIDAGRFREFRSGEDLRKHLGKIARKATAAAAKSKRRRT